MTKRRFLACVLLFTIIFSLLSIPVFAVEGSEESSADEDYLVQEMTTNLPDFKVEDYPTDGSGVPRIIGWTLSEDKGEGRLLQAYLYNPQRLYLDGGYIFYKNISSEGIPYYEEKFMKVVDYSAGSISTLFVKVEFEYDPISTYHKDILTSTMSEIEYIILKFKLDMKVGEDSDIISYNLVDENAPIAVNIKRDGESYSISHSRENVVSLDVKHTVYRTQSTSERGTVDEISSVYFALPEEYMEYYSKLYSVTASYIKKRTKPYLITPAPKEYGKDFYYQDPDWDFWYDFDYRLGDEDGYSYLYGFTTGLKYIKSDAFKYHNSDYVTFFGACNSITEIEDVHVPSSKVLGFFDTCRDYYIEGYLRIGYTESLAASTADETLFSSIEDFSSGITTTVDDTWTSLSYFTSSDAKDYYRDYGLWAWWLATFAKDDDSLYNRLVEKGYIDPDNTDYVDAQRLFVVTDEIRNDLVNLTRDVFCRNYCINENDYNTFKQFVFDNKYVIVYRFDVDSYHFAKIHPQMFDLSGKIHPVDEPYWYAVVEQSLYYDFEVIDVTFKENNQYVSLCTTSEKQNISGGITWVDPDAGFEELPDVDEIVDVLPDFINDNMEDFSEKILSFLRTVGVFLAVVALIVVVVVLFDKGSQLFVAISNRKNKK